MKTKFWNLLLVPVFMICCVMSFSSCSDDDDDDSTTTSIVGTWDCDDWEGYTVQFKSDLTGVESEMEKGTLRQSTFEYKYDDSQNTVTIIGSNETIGLENGTYKIYVGPQKMTFGGLNFSRK